MQIALWLKTRLEHKI